MDTETRLSFFSDMIGCCHNLYLWTYDSSFHLIRSNCPGQAAVNDLFQMSQRRVEFDRQLNGRPSPILFTTDMGLMWVMEPQQEAGELIRLYALGPFFVDDVPLKNLEQQLGRHKLSAALRREFLQFLHALPIISLSRIFEYAIMLHFCVTGEKITASDLRYSESSGAVSENPAPQEMTERHGTYKDEQEMLRMVREGNLNYQAHMSRMSMTGHLGKLSNGDPMRQMKNTVLVCITLFSRAAIEGGLSPEVSFTLTDRYFQSVEACGNISELAEIAHTMQEDFIRRVHRCRTSRLSDPVRACCEYMDLHLEEEITLSRLAQQAGYTEYYLSRKFRQETGLTPKEYLRKKRLERAALLLRTTTEDVQDISERLQFCSQSYFAEHFRKKFGVTPTQYRSSRSPEELCPGRTE